MTIRIRAALVGLVLLSLLAACQEAPAAIPVSGQAEAQAAPIPTLDPLGDSFPPPALMAPGPPPDPTPTRAETGEPADQPQPAADPAATGTPTPPLPTPAPWKGRERVTILVLGVDAREGEPGSGPPRTDTMILLTIDPAAKTAGMLSIPRDLWVEMPAAGKSARINAAYRWGELARLPGGGAGYAVRAVAGLLGEPVHYYLLLDFEAFTGLIDAMGGLKMHIREEIKVDPVGPGNTVILEPGVQTLPGAVVLGYARNRYTERGDFDRIDRQQEVILAIRQQVLELDQLPRLAQQAPALYKKLSAGIDTDLSLDQIIRLAWLAARVAEDDIHQVAIDPRDLAFERLETDHGPQDVLVLKPGRIQALRQRLFGAD